MAAEHLLTLDAGTSGGRCVIFRPGHGVVSAARAPWCYETSPALGPFAKSFDSDQFWSLLSGLTKRALAEAGLTGEDIAAVGVTSQRQGLVVIDDAGRPLYAGPNTDARAAAEGIAIDAERAGEVYASTGKLPSLLMAPARLRWLREHDDTAFRRAASVLTVGDWLAYRLTGERVAERSLAGGCGLLRIETGERDSELLQTLEVPEELLPPLVDAGAVAGAVTKRPTEETGLAAGTPVVVAGADTQCALLGMGVEQPGEAGVVAGWSCTVQIVTAEVHLHPERRTWAGRHVVPDRCVVESNAADAGAMWRWWCETLLGKSDTSLADGAALAAQAAPGSANAMAALGPGVMNAGAMSLGLGGVFVTTPLAMSTVGRPELLRAALENIAYALRANLEQAEQVAGVSATRVALGGGLTRAELFPRIFAGVLGRPLDVAQQPDASACGAAVLAARAVGLDETSLRAPMALTEPDDTETYQPLYERWQRLTGALREVGPS